MEEKLVSVIMPMYNPKENELRLAIESILNQTYQSFEFIIVDDCSTNNSVNIVNEYMEKNKKIILLHNEKNSGIEITLNSGIQKAKSDYIVRMDSDDIAYPNRIEEQMCFLNEHPEFDFIGGRAEFFNDKDGVFRTTSFIGETKKEDFLKGTPFIHPTMILKKSIIEKVGYYPISYRTEDYLLQMELIANGYRGYIIETICLKYRQDENNINRLNKKQRINEIKVKFKGFKMMKVKWYQYVWLLKPMIAMLIPKRLMTIYQKKKV